MIKLSKISGICKKIAHQTSSILGLLTKRTVENCQIYVKWILIIEKYVWNSAYILFWWKKREWITIGTVSKFLCYSPPHFRTLLCKYMKFDGKTFFTSMFWQHLSIENEFNFKSKPFFLYFKKNHYFDRLELFTFLLTEGPFNKNIQKKKFIGFCVIFLVPKKKKWIK